eukprot:scaffold290507_cov27-Tisochrysis_lutea.AAC.4
MGQRDRVIHCAGRAERNRLDRTAWGTYSDSKSPNGSFGAALTEGGAVGFPAGTLSGAVDCCGDRHAGLPSADPKLPVAATGGGGHVAAVEKSTGKDAGILADIAELNALLVGASDVALGAAAAPKCSGVLRSWGRRAWIACDAAAAAAAAASAAAANDRTYGAAEAAAAAATKTMTNTSTGGHHPRSASTPRQS